MNPSLPAELERIINKSLEKDRELRYQSAAEIRTDLRWLKRESDSGRAVIGTAEVVLPPAQRWSWSQLTWGALARLGLARSYALKGDTVPACAAYKDFLTLWKDADPDVPVLKQAKAEYLRLQ